MIWSPQRDFLMSSILREPRCGQPRQAMAGGNNIFEELNSERRHEGFSRLEGVGESS
jgi:hypothetical protein